METIQLRGGFETTDPRLDRIPQTDSRNRLFLVRDTIETQTQRPYTWFVDKRLDQGWEGACVGFAHTHNANARPAPFGGATDEYARGVYEEAKEVDEWEGSDYEGTSVLAGAKVMQSRGFFKEYRWAYTIDDLILAIGHRGPAIMGTDWLEGMYDPDSDGFLRPYGYVAGGHAWLVNGVNIKGKYFKMVNSWGPSWGDNGTAKVSFEDMERLLYLNGEACIPWYSTNRLPSLRLVG